MKKENTKLKKFLATLFVFMFFFAFTSQAKADTISDCGEIAVGGTYTLDGNFGSGGTCITVSAEGVTIDGDGLYTVTGDIVGANGADAVGDGSGGEDSPATVGIGFTLTDITVTGSVTAGNGGVSIFNNGMDGGGLTITNSTISGSITAGSGSNSVGLDPATGGNGGSVTISGSVTGNITAGGGGTGYNSNSGNGGNITITSTNINLSGKSITSGGTTGDHGETNRDVTITNTGTFTTNGSTQISAPGGLSINSTFYGPHSGVFNPLTVGATITSVGQCSRLVFAGTYYLSGNISGDCNIPYQGIIIDGNGHAISGNITSSNGINKTYDYSATNGVSISLIDITVGSVTSGQGGIGNGTGSDAGYSGNISIANSTTTSINTGVGGTSDGGNGGNSGSITITNSTTTSLSTGNGGDSSHDGSKGGDSGSITVTNSTTTSISTGNEGAEGGADGGDGVSGDITLTNSTANNLQTGESHTSGSITVTDSTVNDVSTGTGQASSGSITISKSSLDLSNKILTIGAADTTGTVTLYFTTLTTNTGTYVYNASGLTITGAYTYDYGAWDAVFNPIMPGNISRCGTLNFAGTYTLTGDLSATGTCFITTVGGVVIDGGNHTLTGDGTGIAIDARGQSEGAGGYAVTARNITFANFPTSVDSSGAGNSTGNAGSAGSITVATSTTGIIKANGGDSTATNGNGGNAGQITIWNSDGATVSTAVQSIGGDASDCGAFGEGGQITITNSDKYAASSIDGTATCASTITGGGNVIPPIVTPRSTAPSGGTPSAPAPSRSNTGGSYTTETIARGSPVVTLPVNKNIKDLNIRALPNLNLNTLDKKKENNVLSNTISNFLFTSLPKNFTDKLKPYPDLARFLNFVGISKAQDLINLNSKPVVVDLPKDLPEGIFKVTRWEESSKVTLMVDKNGELFESITVKPGEALAVSLYSKDEKIGSLQATFDNSNITLTGKNTLSANITMPKLPGKYILRSPNSILDLEFVVSNESAGTTGLSGEPKKTLWVKITRFFSGLFGGRGK